MRTPILKNNRKNPQKSFLIVFLIATTILFTKLVLSYNVYGTNDVTYWINFYNVIQKFGSFKIYSLVTIYNHTPLMSWILKLIGALATQSKLSFQFLFRLLPIFADYASIFVIWHLLEKYKMKNRVPICIICSINPINFLISGFHGNVDPVFIFLILLAIYLAEKDNVILSGLVYGLSLCIKIVPILIMPIFIFCLHGIKRKIAFIISFLIITLIVFLPYLISEYYSVTKNIFQYSSLKGIWGLGHLLRSIFNNGDIDIHTRELAFNLFKWHIHYGMIVFLGMVLSLLSFMTGNKKLNLTEGTFLSFCLFLAITPGFGVQYLSWLSFFAVITLPVLGTIYLVLGGFFLYRVYTYWGGGAPPYYANSDRVGQWVGFEKVLDIILWLFVVMMLIRFLLYVIASVSPVRKR